MTTNSSAKRPDAANRLAHSTRPEVYPVDQRRPHLAISRLEGRAVVRSPEQLRPHRAFDQLDWLGVIGEINEASRLTNPSVTEPILITANGTILAGFGRWRSAVFNGRHQIHCIEYLLAEEAALEFILTYHQPRRGWNAFVRTCLALSLEPYLQQQALENMRIGGKYKGSASLPDLRRIDVRQALASVAGVGARTVSNVKKILKLAHPKLKEALGNDTLTINQAIQFCQFAQADQLEHFVRYSEESAISKIIRRAITRPKEEEEGRPEAATILDALRVQEVQQPGSVLIRIGRLQRTVVVIGQDLLAGPHFKGGLKLT